MNKIFFKKFQKKNAGFTLVETLVALSIFSVSLVALMVVLARGISDTGYAEKKETATYLAQEGVEYIRNLRDTYVLYSGTPTEGWNAFNSKLTTGSCASANGCYFDDRDVGYSDQSMPITDMDLNPCTSSNCANAPLLFNPTTGRFNYDITGINSGFTRRIKTSPVTINETKVDVTIFWTQGAGSYNFTFSENLYNWIE